jgi:hypothetical protein
LVQCRGSSGDTEQPNGGIVSASVKRRAQTVEWLTPPAIIAALGPFGLDPCAPIAQPFPTARRTFTVLDNGLIQDWDQDRVWLNPPYSSNIIGRWLARMAEHDRGTALINASTDSAAFAHFVWERATALLFMRGRITFLKPDGMPALRKDGRRLANNDKPSVLCAYGKEDANILAVCGIAGQFVPLRMPRSVFVSIFVPTKEGGNIDMSSWREALEHYFASHEGPVDLAQLYRDFADHPKAKGNPHYQAKLRQQLQLGKFDRVAPGRWKRTSAGTGNAA